MIRIEYKLIKETRSKDIFAYTVIHLMNLAGCAKDPAAN